MKKISMKKWGKVVTVNPFVFGGKYSLAKSLLDDNGDPYLTTEGKLILDKIGTKRATLEVYSNYEYYLNDCFGKSGIKFLNGKKGKKCSDLIGFDVVRLRFMDNDYKKSGVVALKKYFSEEKYKKIIKSFDGGKCADIYGPLPQNALYILTILWYWSKKYPKAKFHVHD